ncbi:hypothetical protein FRX31_032164, partial [Thalictrum thalictroides]
MQIMGWHLANRCALCSRDEETISHLFQSCSVSAAVWRGLVGNCQAALQLVQEGITGLIAHWPLLNLTGIRAVLWPLLLYSVVWSVWVRNEIIFEDVATTADKITKRVKASLWAWMAMVKGSLTESLKEAITGSFLWKITGLKPWG